jgi:uncharacterized YigZ family protein
LDFSFKTIRTPAEGLYKEKGSKFLSFAFPVANLDEIKSRVDELRQEYFEARHHCFAWVLGTEKKYRAYDDGEPNHSAGDPILGQIRSLDLTNILVVVVRYFGGVKLGVGGLISAYKSATTDVLSKAIIIEKQVVESVLISFPYSSTPEVMKLVKEFEMAIADQNFDNYSELTLTYRLRDREKVLEKLNYLGVMGLLKFELPS